LKGYQQLEGIAGALHQLSGQANAYFQRLTHQVDRALQQNRDLAHQLQQAHSALRRLASCLHYPPDEEQMAPVSADRVEQAVQALLAQLRLEVQGQEVGMVLYGGLRQRWEQLHADLLACYRIPGLPQDNLQLEAVFGRLRRHQRRISGRQSTQPLGDFGQLQVLFHAESQSQLLDQLRAVPMSQYQHQRIHLAQIEAHRQFLTRLRRDPLKTMQSLAQRAIHLHRETFLECKLLPESRELHNL
jgi:hypothetical protein